MVNANQRQVGGNRRRFREREADQQRPDQPRALCHRDRADIAPRHRRLFEPPLDDAADVSDVLARRQLGNHAAPLAMNRHLRGDDVRADRPGTIDVAGFFNDGGRRFVARGFDTESSRRI